MMDGQILRRSLGHRLRAFYSQKTFRYSIIYLALLFAGLLVDHYM